MWNRVAHQGNPPIKRHLKSSQANSTPATDGKHVVALFNSGGLYCYDFDGKLIWSKELGRLDAGAFNDPDYQWGFGSSPVIYGEMVFLQCDIQQGSYLAACVFYCVTTGLSPVGATYVPSGITATEASALQSMAEQTVFD